MTPLGKSKKIWVIHTVRPSLIEEVTQRCLAFRSNYYGSLDNFVGLENISFVYTELLPLLPHETPTSFTVRGICII